MPLTFKVAYLLPVFIFVAVQTKAANGRSFFFSIVRFKFHSVSRRLLVVCHAFLGVCVGGLCYIFINAYISAVLKAI